MVCGECKVIRIAGHWTQILFHAGVETIFEPRGTVDLDSSDAVEVVETLPTAAAAKAPAQEKAPSVQGKEMESLEALLEKLVPKGSR